MLIADLEKYLTRDDMHFVIPDFMSKIWSFPNLSSFGTFDYAVSCVLSAGPSICTRTSLYVVFDSYVELSVKARGRFRRAGGLQSVDLTELAINVPIPQQLDKFWISAADKAKSQHLVHQVESNTELIQIPVVLRGYFTDEIVPAQLLHAGGSSVSSSVETLQYIEALTCPIEEADDHIVLHCALKVDHGNGWLLVISNDTDTIVLLRRFFP